MRSVSVNKKSKIKKRDARSKGMVDIGSKKITRRVARAQCVIHFKKSAFEKLCRRGSPKGDVFECARVAGIMAAKNTCTLIPFCHPLLLNKASINFQINKARHQITVGSEVICEAKTGVEMEALTAAATAALTIYDMMKWADRTMVITDLKLVYKSGGTSGIFDRDVKEKS